MKRLLTRLRISSLPCLIMSMLLLAACHDPHTSEILTLADRLMESAPDSAYSLLRSIDPRKLSNGETKAYYALLITQAKIKLDEPVESDSLISIATEYYLRHMPESDKAMRALFYHSQVPCHNRNPLSFLIPSYNISNQLGDSYWVAKNAEQIGSQYELQQNDSLSLFYSRIAAHYYQQANRPLNHLYSLADMMVALTNLNKFNESISLGDSLLKIQEIRSEHPLLLIYILQNKLTACNLSHRYMEADTVIHELDNLPSSSGKEGRRLLYSAQVKLALGNIKSAETYIERSMPHIASIYDKELLFYTLERYYIRIGLTRNALDMVDSLSNLQANRIYTILCRSTDIAETSYYQEQTAIKEAKAIVWRNTVYWISCLAIIILATALCFYILRKRQFKERLQLQEQQLKETLGQIAKLGQQLEETTLSAEKRVSVMQPLMSSLSRILNKVCSEYNIDSASAKVLKALHCNVQSILGELGSKQLYSEIRAILETSNDNVITRLEEQCPTVSDRDVRMILLLKAGFKPQSIALIMGMEPHAVYKARTRLREKIAESSALDKKEFESLLN